MTDPAPENEQSVVYSSIKESSPPTTRPTELLEHPGTSNRVQQIASVLYQELDSISTATGSETIEGLVPLIIRTLEALEDATRDAELYQKENDQFKEEQSHYFLELEREKTLRKQAESKFISLEDSFEDERKKFKEELEKSSVALKQLDLQLRNSNDHSTRLEERVAETKKENSKLQNRINELIQVNAEYLDKVKALQSTADNSQQAVNKIVINKKTPGTFDFGGYDSMPPEMSNYLTQDDEELPDQSFPADHDFDRSEIDESFRTPGDNAGAHSEVQKLIKEYMELQETKEALSIVKDDLITKVDGLTSQNSHFQITINEMLEIKTSLEDRLATSEQQLAQLKNDFNAIKEELDLRKAEDQLPSGQRKRFTSAELRQVINERNRFKKELLELEDAIRLMEMARANNKGQMEFATLSGHELTNAIRMAAEQYSRPLHPPQSSSDYGKANSPGLGAFAKFYFSCSDSVTKLGDFFGLFSVIFIMSFIAYCFLISDSF